MGPPRVPPPKMRDLFFQPPDQTGPAQSANMIPPRPASVISSTDSNGSGKFVRPTSPEDVYDDRERMSYMSVSVFNRNRDQASHNNKQMDSVSSTQHYIPSTMNLHQAPSRQISNTSSNLTTGTTVSGSENWESYSDIGSELEPERDVREVYNSKVHAGSCKRLPGGYAHMAPPPKMRAQNNFNEGNENGMVRIEGSGTTWSTEEENY